MVKGELVMALDFAPRPGDSAHGQESYRDGAGQWYVMSYGPCYTNTHRVTKTDAAGDRWLLAHERPDSIRPEAARPDPPPPAAASPPP